MVMVMVMVMAMISARARVNARARVKVIIKVEGRGGFKLGSEFLRVRVRVQATSLCSIDEHTANNGDLGAPLEQIRRCCNLVVPEKGHGDSKVSSGSRTWNARKI